MSPGLSCSLGLEDLSYSDARSGLLLMVAFPQHRRHELARESPWQKRFPNTFEDGTSKGCGCARHLSRWSHFWRINVEGNEHGGQEETQELAWLPRAARGYFSEALRQCLAERTRPLHQRQSFYSFSSLKEEKKKKKIFLYSSAAYTKEKSSSHKQHWRLSAELWGEPGQGIGACRAARQPTAGRRQGRQSCTLLVGQRKVTEGMARHTALWQRGQEPPHGLPASC